jgi:two-component system response regulator PilR (NtrC family)
MTECDSARILIVDDEKSMRELLAIALEPEGHTVRTVPSVPAARDALAGDTYDLIVSDISMPGETGLDLLEEIRRLTPDVPVILITAYASMEAAKKAFALGVFDCIDKGASFNVEEFRTVVRNALESRRTREENRNLKDQLHARHGPGTLVMASSAMKSVQEMVDRVAPTPATVLIMGESGTGKEVVARAIHYASNRSQAPLVSINCGALPAELLESELFGHVKGAFTGAVAAKKGLFQVAVNGTVFLDEIGEMPLPAQVRLLRVLQERTIRMVGGTEEIPVDTRVLAATNADLSGMVADGRFREDLFYRINVIPIFLPPLRERREDIPLLADVFARRIAKELGRSFSGFQPEAMAAMEACPWPGNVRELENAVRRAVTLCAEGPIPLATLPAEVLGKSPAGSGGAATDAAATVLPDGEKVDHFLDHLKAELMQQALADCNYVQMEAARKLGMSFRSFRYYAKQFKLDVRPPGKGAGSGSGE